MMVCLDTDVFDESEGCVIMQFANLQPGTSIVCSEQVSLLPVGGGEVKACLARKQSSTADVVCGSGSNPVIVAQLAQRPAASTNPIVANNRAHTVLGRTP